MLKKLILLAIIFQISLANNNNNDDDAKELAVILSKIGIDRNAKIQDVMPNFNFTPEFKKSLSTVYTPMFCNKKIDIFEETILKVAQEFYNCIHEKITPENVSIFVQNLKSMALLVENELKLPIELRTKYGLTEKMIEEDDLEINGIDLKSFQQKINQ